MNIYNQSSNCLLAVPTTTFGLTFLNPISLPKKLISVDDKKEVLDAAVDWMRHNDPTTESLDDPTIIALSNIAGVPIPKKMTQDEKKKALEDIVDFVRNKHDILPELIGPDDLEPLSKLGNVNVPAGKLNPNDKAKALQDATAACLLPAQVL